jgi:hypothetical protein
MTRRRQTNWALELKNNLLEGKEMESAFIIVRIEKT